MNPRAVVMLVLVATGCTPSGAQPALQLEARDPADRVRAMYELTSGDPSVHSAEVISALVDRLDDDDEAVRFFAIAALERLTGKRCGYRPFDPPARRRPAVDRWRKHVANGDLTSDRNRTDPANRPEAADPYNGVPSTATKGLRQTNS